MRALPTTFSKERWGPKLLEYVQGEAEELFEDVSLDKLTSEDGHVLVFQILDEKYQELKQDEMHRALKEYFYEVQIKPGESYRNFQVRLETAQRRLVQHNIKLPEEVQGWFVLRKLKLDANAEALILTATNGSVKISEINRALRAVYPNGKGSVTSKKDKEIFIADEAEDEGVAETYSPGVEVNDSLEVMEAVSEQFQEMSDYESEDALEVYETYREIKKRVQEKKTSRGFKPVSGQRQRFEQQWQVQGNLHGKLALMKSKTRCHLCNKVGHWKKECPGRKGGPASRTTSSSSSKGNSKAAESEVNLVEGIFECP